MFRKIKSNLGIYTMKSRVSACILVMLLFPLMGRAQDTIVTDYKNTVKVNSAALLLSNLSLLYERKLNTHWTVLTGAGYRWGGSVPKAFGLGEVIVSSKTNGITGFSITPEVRYYFNFCECGGPPSGFYAGLYGRYTKYWGSLNFHFWNGSEYKEALVASNLRELGAGLQLGYQFVFKQRWTVDIMFAGPRLSTYKLSGNLDSEDMEALISIIEEEINKKLDWLGMDPISIDPSTEFETNFGFRNFRYAIGFGILF